MNKTIEQNTNNIQESVEVLNNIYKEIGAITLDQITGKYHIVFKIEERND